MIFVTDAAGKATYLSAEWTALTGQALEEAVDYGWARVVHAEDRETVRGVVAEAIRRRCAFTVRYRLLCRDGRALWVMGGAVPSFGPPGGTFLGFLGSITRIPPDSVPDGRAQGALDSFELPGAAGAGPPRTALENAADHLIAAHALLVQHGDEAPVSALRAVLYQVGTMLAKGEEAGDAPLH